MLLAACLVLVEQPGRERVRVRVDPPAVELVAIRLGRPLAVQVRAMIADWLTGYELAVAVEAYGPSLHRIIGLKAALARFSTSAYYVASRLG